MERRLLSGLWLAGMLLWAIAATGQNFRLAIFPFTRNGVEEKLAQRFEAHLQALLDESGHYERIDQAKVEQRLKSQRVADQGELGKEGATAVAEDLGARVVVWGSLIQTDGRIRSDAQFLDVPSGSLISLEKVVVSETEGPEALAELVADLFFHKIEVQQRLTWIRDYLGAEQYDKALSNAGKLTDLAPDAPEGYFYSGVALRRMGDRSRAIQAFREALEQDSTYAKAYQELASLYLEAEDLEAAAGVYRHLVAHDSGDAGNRLLYGYTLHRLERYPDAISQYLKGLEADPENLDLLKYLAVAYGKVERPEDAAKAYEKVIELQGDEVEIEVLQALRGNYFREKQYEDAARTARRLTEVQPNSPDAWFWYGYTLDQADRQAEAAQAYEKARSVDPNYPEIDMRLGLVYEKLGKHGEAETAFNRAAAKGGGKKLGQAFLALCNSQKKQSRFFDAFRTCQNASRYDSSDTVVFYLLGEIHQELGKIYENRQTLDDYRRALEQFKASLSNFRKAVSHPRFGKYAKKQIAASEKWIEREEALIKKAEFEERLEAQEQKQASGG